MKNKDKLYTIVIVLSIIIIVITFIISKQKTAVNGLVNPRGAIIEQTVTPSPTPKTFKYDSSTDLSKELESIDPKVLDSDFDE